MEKYYVDGAEITRFNGNRFHITGYKNEQIIVDFIAKDLNLEEFTCTWVKKEEFKVSRGWIYQDLKIVSRG